MRAASLPVLLGRWEATERPLARVPRGLARLALALLLAGLVWSSLAASAARSMSSGAPGETSPIVDAPAAPAPEQALGSGDLALYERIRARVAAGEPYYAAAMDEQRARDYPTRPFVAVRLPTLAVAGATLGLPVMRVLAGGLLVVAMAAMQRRLAERTTRAERIAAQGMLVFGGAAAFVLPQVGLIHEVFAGLLLALALLLYRPGRWGASLIAAALALAIRELAAPFVFLWLALALAGARWREAAGVAGLLVLFAIGMGAHYAAVEAGRLASDPVSQGWGGLAGPGLPLVALIRLTPLALLPPGVAGPLALLPLVGWAGLGGRLGLLASLWFAGFLIAVALLARPDTFYWTQLVLPAYAVGLALAPRAIADLGKATLAPAASEA